MHLIVSCVAGTCTTTANSINSNKLRFSFPFSNYHCHAIEEILQQHSSSMCMQINTNTRVVLEADVVGLRCAREKREWSMKKKKKVGKILLWLAKWKWFCLVQLVFTLYLLHYYLSSLLRWVQRHYLLLWWWGGSGTIHGDPIPVETSSQLIIKWLGKS